MLVLGERLKKCRELKRYTQMEVAKLLGISNGTLSGYERGYRDPDTNILQRLSELYEVSVDYLLGRTDDKKTVLSEEARYILDSLDLSDEEIIDRLELNIDGIPLTPDEVLAFVNYIRISRAKDNPGR